MLKNQGFVRYHARWKQIRKESGPERDGNQTISDKRTVQAFSAVFRAVLADDGLRPVLRGDDHAVRAGAADDHALYHQRSAAGRGGSFHAHGGRPDGAVSGAADRGLHRRLLYGRHRTRHGGEDRDGHAQGRLSASAAAFQYLLQQYEGGADHGTDHQRSV